MAEFVLCEGWCNAVYTAQVERNGDGFAFSHEEVLEFSDGTVGKQTVRYRVVRTGRGLLISYSSQDGFVSQPWRITRLRTSCGIAVARGNGEAGCSAL